MPAAGPGQCTCPEHGTGSVSVFLCVAQYN